MINRKERLKISEISKNWSPPFPRFHHGLADLLHTYSTVLSVSGANQNIRDARDHIFFLAKKRLFLSLYKNFWHVLLGDSLSQYFEYSPPGENWSKNAIKRAEAYDYLIIDWPFMQLVFTTTGRRSTFHHSTYLRYLFIYFWSQLIYKTSSFKRSSSSFEKLIFLMTNDSFFNLGKLLPRCGTF